MNRLLVGSYDSLISQAAKREFAENLKEFIAELKNNPKAEGFIIHNNGMRNRYFKEALRRLRNGKIDRKRFQILRKGVYESYYPEFMTVTITG